MMKEISAIMTRALTIFPVITSHWFDKSVRGTYITPINRVLTISPFSLKKIRIKFQFIIQYLSIFTFYRIVPSTECLQLDQLG